MIISKKNSFACRAVALLTAVALMGALVACGDDGKKKSKKSGGDWYNSSQSTKDNDGPNIIEFDDGDEEDTITHKKNSDDDVVTTTTTTATSKKKTESTTESTTAKTTTTTKKSATTTTTTTTSKPSTTTTSKQPTTTTKSNPDLSNSYKVVSRTYSAKDGNIKCKYPEITGLYDKDMQSFYNEYFKSSCTKGLDDASIETYSGTYEVKHKTKDMLSIVFRESVFYSGAAHGYSSAHAITIDLATGNTVVPSESADMDKAADAINNDTWTLTRSVDGVTKKDVIDYFNNYDEEAIKNMIGVDDMITIRRSGGKYTVSGKTHCNSYFDMNSDPVLIVTVSHALGDYVEVQF